MRVAKIKTTDLVTGDTVNAFSGKKIFSHFEDERTNDGLFGEWVAVTMVFMCGHRETAEKDGYIEIVIK